MSTLVGLKGAYDCVKAFSETDLTEDLKKIDVPVLLVHGDTDQIVPFEDSSKLSDELIPDATLNVCPGEARGLRHHHRVGGQAQQRPPGIPPPLGFRRVVPSVELVGCRSAAGRLRRQRDITP
jgi:pimeloyl-ACP methyl ester carboxylesterase